MSWNCGCRDNRMDQDRMQYRLDDQEFVANLAKRGIGLDEIPEGEVFPSHDTDELKEYEAANAEYNSNEEVISTLKIQIQSESEKKIEISDML